MVNVLLSATAYNLKKWINIENKKISLFIYSRIPNFFDSILAPFNLILANKNF
ncbi:hypothetical protein MNBD_IGNAVI01-2983 [hydrothermal vent metagenome]|uniref:Uncharacterized protein n=1 Tax=hydrothermal vent metagenome TaxID=652676 RepID=A0A3B1CL64_9ZZZZ